MDNLMNNRAKRVQNLEAAKPHKKVHVQQSSESNLATLDHHGLTRQAGQLYRNTTWAAGLYALCGTAYLIESNFTYSLPFLLMATTGWACMAFWYTHGQLGLPAFPVLALQLTFLNSVSLLTGNPLFDDLDASVIWIASGTVALFLAMLLVGWWLGVRTISTRPSSWNILPPGSTSAEQVGLRAGIPLLLFGILFQIGSITGFTYQMLPGEWVSFLPVITAFAGSATSLGGFLGGMAIAKTPFRIGALWFWFIFAISFFLMASGFLLSTAIVLIFSCAIGMGFGAHRIPWGFLIITCLVLGFLNQGKFVMRKNYWDPETDNANIQLSMLPQIYAEWAEASVAMFQDELLGETPVVPLDDEEAGQSLLSRAGNLQNLTFIVNVLQQGTSEPLYGKTYFLIPDLLIPRFLWHDKPRTHAGQVMLNLNFGRQATEEETFVTYVAWGPLPEAVGNFGTWTGACFLGLVAGFGCGLLEAWSARKRIFSVEGLVAIAMLVEIAGSYELVASVLIPSIFQLLIAVMSFGLLLRFWFGKTPVRNPMRRVLPRTTHSQS